MLNGALKHHHWTWCGAGFGGCQYYSAVTSPHVPTCRCGLGCTLASSPTTPSFSRDNGFQPMGARWGLLAGINQRAHVPAPPPPTSRASACAWFGPNACLHGGLDASDLAANRRQRSPMSAATCLISVPLIAHIHETIRHPHGHLNRVCLAAEHSILAYTKGALGAHMTQNQPA